MPHTHEFDCRICRTHLDSQSELDRHISANHPESLQASDSRDRSNESESRPQNRDIDEDVRL